MSRSLLVVAICFATATWLLAEEPASSEKTAYKAPAVLQAPKDAAPAATMSARRKIEAQLQSPAKLDFGDRQTVTIREVLDQLRQQHLSVRFDMPTVSGALASYERATGKNIAIARSAPADESAEIAPANVSRQKPVPAPTDEGPETAKSDAAHETTERTESPSSAEDLRSQMATLLETQVDLSTIDLASVSVATVVRHAFDAVPVSLWEDDFAGLPIEPTDAWHLDYVVEDDGLLVTTRLNALTRKETHVYSVKHLKDFTPDELAKVIRQSVRPWSWRSQINEFAEQLKLAAAHVSPKTVSELMKSSVQLTSCAVPVQTAKVSDATDAPECKTCDAKPASEAGSSDAAQLTEDASTVIDVLTAFAQAAVSAVEIVHYADPPTGTIQTLPGKLVITQSQAAHREIAELLKELGED
jgi:hypothetical protein